MYYAILERNITFVSYAMSWRALRQDSERIQGDIRNICDHSLTFSIATCLRGEFIGRKSSRRAW